MTDQIGPVSLQRVHGFTKNGRQYTILGDMANQADLQSLEELCRDSDVGSALHRIPGGRTKGEDLNEEERYTVLCQFDDPDLPDGYYLLRTPVKRSEDGPVFRDFQMTLFYMGSKADYQPGLEVDDITDETNDWSIKGALENALPVGAYDVRFVYDGVEYFIDVDAHCFTRTGVDGAEKILRLFGGDEFLGEYLEPGWRKGWDGDISVGTARTASGYLEMTGVAAVAGTPGAFWIDHVNPVLLLDTLELTVKLQTPIDDSGAAADRDLQYEFYLRQDKDEASPRLDDNFLRLYYDINETGLIFYLTKEVNGSHTVLFSGSTYDDATTWDTGDLEGTIWRFVFHGKPGTTGAHIHVYLKQKDTIDNAEGETENELSTSPYDTDDFLFFMAYPAFRIWTENTTYWGTAIGSANGTDCKAIEVTYPDPFIVKYKVAAANEYSGACEIWDGDPDSGGSLVEDLDHVFSGDCYIQNGLIRLHVDEALVYGLKLYYWTGATWSQPVSSLFYRLMTDDIAVNYSFIRSIQSISSEKIVIKIRLRDSEVTDDDYYIDLMIEFERGKRFIKTSYEEAFPNQEIRIAIFNSPVIRFSYTCDESINDVDIPLGSINTTLSDNFGFIFDDEGDAFIFSCWSNQKPDGTYKRFNLGANSTFHYEYMAYIDILITNIYFGITPFSLVANLFMEAEDATISAAARLYMDGAGEDTVTENDGVWAATLNCAVDENNLVENSVGSACVEITSSAAGAVQSLCTPAAPLGKLIKFDDLNLYLHGTPNGDVTIRLIDADGDSMTKAQTITGSATQYTIDLPHSDTDKQGWTEVGTFDYTTLTTLRIEWTAAAGGELVYVDGLHEYIGTTTTRGRGETLSGGVAVVLDAHNEAIIASITAGTHLPEGYYLQVLRIKDTDQVVNDCYMHAYNQADAEYRNQAGKPVNQTLTAVFAYYLQLMHISAADASGTNLIRIPQFNKNTAGENTVFIDYVLRIFLGDGESGPMDLAHSALKTSDILRRLQKL